MACCFAIERCKTNGTPVIQVSDNGVVTVYETNGDTGYILREHT